jgi:hypothetical protein
MAALMPGASASFSLVDRAGKLGARIDETFLPDLASRKKFAAARVPNVVDVGLDELLSLQPSRLARKLDGARVVDDRIHHLPSLESEASLTGMVDLL